MTLQELMASLSQNQIEETGSLLSIPISTEIFLSLLTFYEIILAMENSLTASLISWICPILIFLPGEGSAFFVQHVYIVFLLRFTYLPSEKHSRKCYSSTKTHGLKEFSLCEVGNQVSRGLQKEPELQ